MPLLEAYVQNAEHEMNVLDNKARFITAVVEGKLVLANRKKQDVIEDMEHMAFDKQLPDSKKAHQTEATVEDGEGTTDRATYNYLLRMPIDQLTLEKVQELQAELEAQKRYVLEISQREPKDMWREDLRTLREVT